MSSAAYRRLLLAKKKQAERARLQAIDFKLDDFLFQEQLAFVRDPARFAVACCSVRAGKTVACAADLIETAIKMDGTIGCYITLARSSAERIVWPELKKINRDFNLGGIPNESKLALVFPNDSTIYLMGGNDPEEIEKIRGLSNVALVYIDEMQALRQSVKGLIEDVVTKRLYDTNGRCRAIGTPGPVPAGYFYDITRESSKWARHHWTMFNNPWLERKSGLTPGQLTDQDCAIRGVTTDDPSIRRENYGEWCRDESALLLNYDRDRNSFDDLPPGKYTYILGVDFGQRDLNFLSLLAFTQQSKVTYLVEEKYAQGQLTDDLAVDIKDVMSRYDVAKIVCDTGGLGLAIAEDLKARYGLPLEGADKKGKMSNYALLNNALRTGMFKAKHSTLFATDCNLLQRDYDRTTPEKIHVKGHSDAVDAALYAFKFSPSFMNETKKPGLTPADDGYATSMWEQNEQKLRDKKNDQESNPMTWTTDNQGVPPWQKW